MQIHQISNLTRTAIKAAYRIAGLDTQQTFAAWLEQLLDQPNRAASVMYELLDDVIQSKYGPFRSLPQLEQHAIMIAMDVLDFAVTLCSDRPCGELFLDWEIEVSEGLFDESVCARSDSVRRVALRVGPDHEGISQ